MVETTPSIGSPERSYSVVRYVDQWPLGRVRKVLAEDMTFNEALEFAQREIEGIASQAIAILNEAKPGWELEVKPMQSEP